MIRWLPNLVSLLRLLLTIPYFLWLSKSPFSQEVVLLALIITLSDKIDGFLARKLKVTSKLGEVLDSFADSVFFVGTWILFFIKNLISLGFFIGFLIPRAIVLISLCIFYLRKKRWSNKHFIGNKITGVTHFMAILWFLLEFPGSELVLMLALIVGCIAALWSEYERHSQKI